MGSTDKRTNHGQFLLLSSENNPNDSHHIQATIVILMSYRVISPSLLYEAIERERERERRTSKYLCNLLLK
jgi:hypothetical protein